MTPWTVAHQAPLSMRFYRQEYWGGLPFPSPSIFRFYYRERSQLHQIIAALKDDHSVIRMTVTNSVKPHRWQPTRLPRPWDSPGKNSGMSCHFLLQCMKVKRESEVAQSCLTPSDPMDCSLPGSSVHGISQARVLEYGAH